MAKPRNENLTERELDVLKLLCFKKPEIAKKLFISTSTVQTYINNLYDKLYVHSREQALIKALKTGIITIDEVTINDFQRKPIWEKIK